MDQKKRGRVAQQRDNEPRDLYLHEVSQFEAK